MAAAPTINEAITRLSENENRIDIFTNQDGFYLTNETVPRQVESLPSLVARIQDRYLNIVYKGDWTTSANYVINDVVKESGIMYLCVTTHIAGVFAADLAASKWVVYQGDLRAADVANSTDALKGAGMVGYEGGLAYADGSVGAALNERLPEIGSYAALDAYDGDATAVLVSGVTNIFDGGAGVFRRTTDTPSAANGIYRQDAVGRWWKRDYSGAINLKWFGAVPIEQSPGFDSTGPLFHCFAHVNDMGGKAEIEFDGTYLIGTFDTSTLPDDGGWRQALKTATAGYGAQSQIVLYGVDDVIIKGPGGIKVKDSGTPTTSILKFGSVFCVDGASKNVTFDGLHIDCNRINQFHTSGTNTGHNEAIFASGDCSNITVQNCLIENTGSLRDGGDKRGEAFICENGIRDVFFRHNVIKNMGRWAFVLEFGQAGGRNIHIEGNTYYGAIRGVTPANPNDYEPNCIGFVDIEHWLDYSDVFIRNNTIYKSGVISFGGYIANSSTTIAKNIVIEGNTWHCEEIAGFDGYERIVNASGGTGTNTKRTFEEFHFRKNKIYYGSAALSTVSQNRILSLEQATFKNAFIEDNYIDQYSGTVTGGDEAGMNFYQCRLLGEIRYARNVIVSSSARGGWFGLRSELVSEFGNSNCNVHLIGNVLTNGNRGFSYDFDAASTVNMYLFDNRLNCTNGKTSEIVQGVVGNTFRYVADLPVSTDELQRPFKVSYLSSSAAKRSGSIVTKSMDTNSTVLFRIKLDTTRPWVQGNLVLTEINQNQNAAHINLNFGHYGGAWYAATPTAIEDTSGGPAPTVTINGNYIDIAWAKQTGSAYPALLTYDLLMVNCSVEIPT